MKNNNPFVFLENLFIHGMYDNCKSHFWQLPELNDYNVHEYRSPSKNSDYEEKEYITKILTKVVTPNEYRDNYTNADILNEYEDGNYYISVIVDYYFGDHLKPIFNKEFAKIKSKLQKQLKEKEDPDNKQIKETLEYYLRYINQIYGFVERSENFNKHDSVENFFRFLTTFVGRKYNEYSKKEVSLFAFNPNVATWLKSENLVGYDLPFPEQPINGFGLNQDMKRSELREIYQFEFQGHKFVDEGITDFNTFCNIISAPDLTLAEGIIRLGCGIEYAACMLYALKQSKILPKLSFTAIEKSQLFQTTQGNLLTGTNISNHKDKDLITRIVAELKDS